MSKKDMAERLAKLQAGIAYLEQEVAMRDLMIDQLKAKKSSR